MTPVTAFTKPRMKELPVLMNWTSDFLSNEPVFSGQRYYVRSRDRHTTGFTVVPANKQKQKATMQICSSILDN